MSEFENEMLVALIPYLKEDQVNTAKMIIDMVSHNYTITKETKELAVYEGDVNEQMLKRFLMAKMAKGCSSRTVGYYKQTLTWFFTRCGKPYMDVTSDDIRYYLALRVQRDGVSKTTANNERRNLSAFYGFLQAEEILLKNPMSKVDPIKETKKKKKAYELMDLEKIRVGCRTKREKAMVEVLASTWCRVSEAVQIKITDIDINKIIVHGKGDKDREVYLNARAIVAVTAYLAERSDKNQYLFPKARYTVNAAARYTRGKKQCDAAEWYMDPEMVDDANHMDASTFESIIRRIGKRAGVENVHPHRFRRTGATMALRTGMPITTVSKLLGHSSIETTQIYLDIPDAELEQAHAKYVI